MSAHVSVLLHETVDAVLADPNGLYVDCTLGRGGHTAYLLSQLGEDARVIGFDRDPDAIAFVSARFADDPRFVAVHAAFGDLESELGSLGLTGQVDGIIADLGVSSPQLDVADRGFSFQVDGPLDMRMDPTRGVSAADWLARVKHPDLARALRTLGDEKNASRIASAILEARVEAPIQRTLQLAAIVKAAHPRWEPGRHPATKTFQAIRIAVNAELEQIDAVLPQILSVMKPAGRMAVISFHSLEDRRIKRFIRDQANPPGDPLGLLPQPAPRLRPLGKAIRPSTAEVEANPRSRSSVLRVAEKCAVPA
ncbi:16S rRNA (cytosine(1402)-N(4))-methyltransferase RsmH [Litorivicinus lipolyticus]|uniref:Ribosomal RNA small subunit methyltransferase H n=1 Tax=Litorivicinus lipolyticus TaxID=418701 RepID=A0A5Q2QF43_9GAMM|nr:16S rRNA (cytosine(1402)-N(4))-methyltransferase RsmH [Litorivicinus lipolyticus]QGG80952.1 16S rRNA (cytosine(1402)-N(4))-methyltransferase RsmH [Litorivicinus lipolyticus]